MPNLSKDSTRYSLGETPSPKASLILSYLILVGIGILHTSKLCFPDILIALCTSRNSSVLQLVSPPKTDRQGSTSLLRSLITLSWPTPKTRVAMRRRLMAFTQLTILCTTPADMPLPAFITI
ncbi:unnamed protein product [Meganyctiphanes norvegica]|uniref:Uncharacterized protein n=1 Tax=Meganyctiphanes norvegica TaxID=48144 RepID=A0AAV2SDU0_MEGNR